MTLETFLFLELRRRCDNETLVRWLAWSVATHGIEETLSRLSVVLVLVRSVAEDNLTQNERFTRTFLDFKK